MRRAATAAAVTAAATALALAGCAGGGTSAGEDEALTVLAAASLTESFDALATVFEDDHPGVRVVLGYDSSATLAAQVADGAPGDVLATADTRTMQVALDAGAVSDPVDVATNRLVLVVPADNPAGVQGIADLDDPAVDYVVCAESAPCGALARRLLDSEGIEAPARSLEVDVKAVLGKVVLDEADAGLVYTTDARAAGDRVETLAVPGAEDLLTRYPAAVLTESSHPRLAQEWLDLLASERGRRVLAEAGFGPP